MKKLILLLIFINISIVALCEEKKPLTWNDVLLWNRVSEKSISNDGEFIAIKNQNWKGESVLKVYDNKAELIIAFKNATNHQFLNNHTVLFVQEPLQKTKDSLERAKSKNKAQQSLIAYDLITKDRIIIDSLKSYKASKESATIAYIRGGKKNKTLQITNKNGAIEIDEVKQYIFSKDGNELMYLISDTVKNSIGKINLDDLKKVEIYETPEEIKSITISEDGSVVAFVVGSKNDKIGTSNKLYTFTKQLKEIEIPSNSAENWIINHHANLSFTEDNKRLYFGTSPRFIEPDTLTLKSQKAVVDVWHWNEPVLHTQQINKKSKELKRSYKAVALLEKGASVQLADTSVPTVVVSQKGAGNIAYAQTTEPYKISTMWRFDTDSDLYLIDIESGNRTLLKEKFNARVNLSPEGEYLYWYAPAEKTWNSYNIEQKKKFEIASPKNFITYDDINDEPNYPSQQGEVGWETEDRAFYVYGKYDIWKLDPQNAVAPKNITRNGTATQTKYKVINLDSEKKSFDKNERLLLYTFDTKTKGSAFATVPISGARPKVLISDLMRYSGVVKAKDSEELIFTKESFEQSPEIYLTDISFKDIEKLSDINPQQSDFNWGTVEQVSWVSLVGDTLQGLIFKPENFDATKKYPLICNFYDRDSDNRFSYRTPEPHRSTIDYHYYTSNGYVIFNPDNKYYDGHPGKSCYDAVMPGLDKVIEFGYIDTDRIGAQGHSWGGYQVAHLATKTDRFAAIESGAPVVNMLSAYGGIRWATGRSRAYQYEKGQSRIGGTPWENPELYLENSPLMEMDKVTTPILIMHNDKDGHVPWTQAIEYFIALRRLQQPVWLLNYNDEPHWPTTIPNKLDFQIKMSQFFNHYLKGEKVPSWMENGIQAIEK